MTDYRKLSKFYQKKVDKEIKENIEPKHHKNPGSGFEYDEPEFTLNQVHLGNSCANCWMVYYNCLCSHEN